MRYRHQLDLLELVLAEHSARVAARRPGLGAEALRVRGQPHRQRLRVQQLARVQGRQRHLGGRNQPQPSRHEPLLFLPNLVDVRERQKGIIKPPLVPSYCLLVLLFALLEGFLQVLEAPHAFCVLF